MLWNGCGKAIQSQNHEPICSNHAAVICLTTEVLIVKIHILVTGGTFDKEYNELTGEFFFKDTHLPEILSLGRSSLHVEMQTLMMVDSLQMTAADRERIQQPSG